VSTSSQQTGTQQQTQSQSAPWAPTQPALSGIIDSLNRLKTTPTANQTGAVNNLNTAAQSIPNLGPAAEGAASGALGVPSWLQGLFNNYQSGVQPFTDPKNLNPMNTPGFEDALNYQKQQVTDQINGQFAGAGRDLSPANSRALGYGLGGAIAPAIANQYNANADRMSGILASVFGAGNTAANSALGAYNTGTGILGQIPGLATAAPQAQLQAAQTQFGLPYSNLGTKEGMILPIAGLGGQTSGTASGSQNTVNNPSPYAMALGGLNLGGNSIGGSLFSNIFNSLGKAIS